MLLSDVHVGTDQFHHLARRIEDGTTDTMDVLYRAIGKKQTEVNRAAGLFADSSFSILVKPLHIVRVNPTPSFCVPDRAGGRIEAKGSVGFFRPIRDFTSSGIVRKATRVA